MRSRGAIVALAAVLLSGISAPTSAQPKGKGKGKGGAPVDVRPEARARFTDGVAYAKKGDWEKAYDAFLEAWKLKQHPQIALNLGRAELELHKYRDAAEHLRYCVPRLDADDPDLKLARGWLSEAERKASKLAITVNISGADVTVDDVLVGQSPLPRTVLVDPGHHVVKATRDSRSASEEVSVESGESTFVTVHVPDAAPSTTVTAGPQRSSARTGVLIGGGAGALIGIGVGAVFAGLATSKGADVQKCATQKDGRDCATSAANEQAIYKSGALWGFLGGGVVALGTAAFLVFGPRDSKVVVAPAAGTAGAGLIVTGKF